MEDRTEGVLPVIIRKKLKRRSYCFRHVWG